MIPVVLAAVAVVQAGRIPADDGWQVVTVFQERDLSVLVRVKERAKASDEGWLVLEFVSGGKDPLTVSGASYRIEARYDDLDTREELGLGSLASGNDFDLFPDARKRLPVALAPGKPYRVVDQPSNYSTALMMSLVAHHRGSLRLGVRAALHMRLEARDGRAWQTPHEGVSFAFDWVPFDAADVDTMRRRLEAMLAGPSRYYHEVNLLGAYLDLLAVADGVTRDQLLAALRRRPEGSTVNGRKPIAGHLAKRFATDPVVRDYYLDAFKSGHWNTVVLDLLGSDGFWHPSLVGPLADLCTTDGFTLALEILHEHSSDWVADGVLARRLSAAVLARCPLLRTRLADLKPEQLPDWAREVRQLALTGDKSLVANLQPALDDVRSCAQLEHVAWGMLPRPTRVCDAALNAILTLLDGGIEAAYQDAGLSSWSRGVALDKARDGMIAELKKRLNER
jgi:hypothetical protein